MCSWYKQTKLFIALLLLAVPAIIKAAEIEETVLGMNVSGNKEAPNLLYIIPWKESSEKASPPEVYRLMDEVYSTVDPDVFKKEVGFFEQLQKSNTTVVAKDDD
jgi:hypothetical protein